MIAHDAPFDEPWQAQLFALTVAMNEGGLFAWSDWSAIFGPMVKGAPSSEYWRVWSEALIVLLQENGFAEAADITATAARWQAAAHNTPHGEPIRLDAAGAG